MDAVGDCIRDTLRSPDVAGRLGGDEFGLLLINTRASEAAIVAARIAERLAAQPAGPDELPLTLSFGVVEVAPQESIDQALARADAALYEAKRTGRNRAVVGPSPAARHPATGAPTFGRRSS